VAQTQSIQGQKMPMLFVSAVQCYVTAKCEYRQTVFPIAFYEAATLLRQFRVRHHSPNKEILVSGQQLLQKKKGRRICPLASTQVSERLIRELLLSSDPL
jgi:hypothetical protein